MCSGNYAGPLLRYVLQYLYFVSKVNNPIYAQDNNDRKEFSELVVLVLKKKTELFQRPMDIIVHVPSR